MWPGGGVKAGSGVVVTQTHGPPSVVRDERRGPLSQARTLEGCHIRREGAGLRAPEVWARAVV